MKAKLVSYAGAALLLITLSLYLLTACPTIYAGDTGELVSAAYTLGVPHPPGYPLFCLTGKMLTFLPAGNVAFRVNLLAVLTAAGAILIFFLLSKKVYDVKGCFNILLLLLLCLIAASSRVFWNQSGMAKGALYTMTAFLLLSSVLALETWRKNGRTWHFIVAAFLAGLSVVSHQTALVFIPAFVTYSVFTSIQKKTHFTVFIMGTVAFAAGLSVFFYLMLSAARYPQVNCGNPSTFQGMLQHVLRSQYGGLTKYPRSISLFLQEVKACFLIFTAQFPIWVLFIPFAGMFASFRKMLPLFLLSAVIITALVFGLMVGTVYDITAAMLETTSVFMIPAYFFLWLWAYPGTGKIIGGKNSLFLKLLLLLLTVSALFYNVYVNGGYADKSANFMAERYAVDTLRSCPPDSVIFMSEDSPMYQLLYAKTVNRARPDVKIIDETATAFRTVLTESDSGVIFKGEVLKRASEYMEGALKNGMPVLCTSESSFLNTTKSGRTPSGLLYLIKGPNMLSGPKTNYWENCLIPEPPLKSDVFNRDMYARYHFMKAESLFESGNKKGFIEEMKKAESISQDMDWVRSEMAMIYGNRGFKAESLSAYESAAALFRYSTERRNNLANAYLAAGRIAEAIRELETACSLDKNLAAPRHNLGNAYFAAGKREEARAAYEEAALLGQTESLDSLNNLAGDLEKKGMKEQALQEYIHILSINKGYVFAWINAGNIFYGQNKLEDAIRFYSNAAAVRPDYPEGYFNLGVAYYKKGDLVSAKQYWQRTLQIAPAHAGALNAINLVK